MKNKYEIKPITKTDYGAVASVYARVFAGEPWKEVSRCNRCGEFSDKNTGENAPCKCGGSYDLEAYPLAPTTAYVEGELAKPDAVGLFLAQASLLTKAERAAYGFGWGFQMTPEELSQKKYRTAEMQQLIAQLLVNTDFFYYVSEVGVLPLMQGLGFGKELTSGVIDLAQKKGQSQFVVRTNEDSAMRYILENMGMQPIVGLKTGIKDTENEARVLFVNKK